jgi:ADP-heptose:LPS heptosyltransferase
MQAIPFIKKEHIYLYKSWQSFPFRSFDKIYCFESKKRIVNTLPPYASCLPPAGEMVEHYSLRCLRQVYPESKMPSAIKPYLTIKPQEETLAVLQTQGISASTLLVGLHPTYSGSRLWGRKQEHLHRLWPTSHFAKLAHLLKEYAKREAIDLQVVMNVLPQERKRGMEIEKQSQGAVKIVSLPLSFDSYLVYLQRLNVLVVANTGVMHLGAALSKPLVALFSKYDPKDCGPYMEQERFSVLQAENTAHPQQGLRAIQPEKVYEHVLALLS